VIETVSRTERVVTDRESTVRSRELGARLRRAMAAARVSGKDMAARLGMAESQISRALAGRRGGDLLEVAAILAVCGVDRPARAEVLALCNEHHERGAFRVEGDQRWVCLVGQALEARKVTEFAPLVVPWMFQTGDYTRALADASGVPAEEVDEWVSHRAQLGRLLTTLQPPRLSVVLHEWVVRTPVGDRSVMCDQVHHLLRLSVQPGVSVRVVPVGAGAHAGMAGGFSLLDYERFRPVAYREDASAGVFLEDFGDIETHRGIGRRLSRAALDEQSTRILLRNVAVEFYAEDGPQREFVNGGVA
jgi:transcriptional regulator with XRE-family HTH domain